MHFRLKGGEEMIFPAQAWPLCLKDSGLCRLLERRDKALHSLKKAGSPFYDISAANCVMTVDPATVLVFGLNPTSESLLVVGKNYTKVSRIRTGSDVPPLS